MKRSLILMLTILLLITACSCSSRNTEDILAGMESYDNDYIDPNAYSPEPATPSPVPSESLDDIPDYRSEGEATASQAIESDDAFSEKILTQMKETNILNYIPADTYQKTEDSFASDVITSQPDIAYSLQGSYVDWFNAAANSLLSSQAQKLSLSCEAPSWRLLATLAYNYAGEPDNLKKALYSACDFTITGGNGDTLSIIAAPKDPLDYFYSMPEDGNHPALMNLFTYAYLSTIYDNQMNVRDGIGEPELEPLLFPIENPSNYYYDDTWYADRDGGARRHTGTDINAPEGTSLLACVDGTIKDAGLFGGAGNYIVVEGSDGTQYHYYHMVEPPTLTIGATVRAGDVVGYVGNTGNSTANHLHFTIITTNGYYVNPYTYLKTAQQAS